MNIIETENIRFSFSSNRHILDGVNLQVRKGSIFGFLGVNGAGKTTTIKLLLNLLKSEKGSIKLFNKSYTDSNNLIHKNIGSLIEAPALYNHLSGYDNLKISSIYRGVDPSRIFEVAAIVNLSSDITKKVKHYSMGMKQRLGIANALLHDPELLILDEPINGLDPKGIIQIRNLIIKLNREYGKTIFLSSHLLSEIENCCNEVGIISSGKIVFQGSIDQLKKTKSSNYSVLFELDSLKNLDLLIEKHDGKLKNNGLTLNLSSKDEIPEINSWLIENNYKIYQIKRLNDNIENLFLDLTGE